MTLSNFEGVAFRTATNGDPSPPIERLRASGTASAFGLAFSPHSDSDLVALMTTTPPAGSGVRAIVTANLDHIVRLLDDREFRDAYRHAWAVTADGLPVYVYARMRGAAPPARVTGSDLVASLLRALRPDRDRPFFVACTEETAELICASLIRRGFRADSIGWAVPPRGFELDQVYSNDLATRIRRHRTTHLVFGVGSPKSEIWIHRHRSHLGDCFALSVGAGLEFFVSTKRRAPVWMQRSGLEWLWRVGQEPARLWRRYAFGGVRFLGAVASDLSGRVDWSTEADPKRG